MRRVSVAHRLILFGFVVFMVAAPSASAGGFLWDNFSDGEWRVEVSGVAGTYSGRYDRDGDYFVTGKVEYAWPVHARVTLGLRAYPLFVYEQDDPNETLWGAGVGVATRFYKDKETYRGLFAEGGLAALGHKGKLEGNTANLNFLLEAGVGYQFESNWHLALKFHHISNAGLSSSNGGTNGFGLAVGYTF